ncbi:hypothetical protein K435DRAFT_921689 [Dendrothele bispora CBS 962.96]|uniref:Carboxylic ester hydrolase n=1 Tax=Dendrothele bispora (strain CBS 962.96) TaxID=1314807 RepID=A0A4S8MHW8_DENBC|nr:hypothetical protein K435DRAFT_921689 [Dendrothele bispora CBS 962.96]
MQLNKEQQDEFYRLFRISGMGHCSGGIGAWKVGQTLAGSGNLVNLDPESNVLTAMVSYGWRKELRLIRCWGGNLGYNSRGGIVGFR